MKFPASLTVSTSGSSTVSSDYEILQDAMSVAQMPLQMVSFLMVLGDAVITQNSLTKSATAHTETLTLDSALAKRMAAVCSDAGYTVDFTSFLGSYTVDSFIYNDTTSKDTVYDYYVHFAMTLAGEGMDATIYWSSDEKHIKALVKQSTSDSDYSGDDSKMGIIYDGDAKTTCFVYYSDSAYMSAKVAADSSSSANGVYIGIYDMNSSTTTLAESVFGDDNGGVAILPSITYYEGSTVTGTSTFCFDTTGAEMTSSNSYYSTLTSKIAGIGAAFSSLDTLAMLTKLSCSLSIPGTGSVVLAGANSVAKGSAYTVSVNGSYDSYEWLLDGDTISGQTSTSVTIDTSSLTLGSHSVTAFVTDSSGDEFSASLTFSVTN